MTEKIEKITVMFFPALSYFCLTNWTEIKDIIQITTKVIIRIQTALSKPKDQLLHIDHASISETLLWKKYIVKISTQYITSKQKTIISLNSLSQRNLIQELIVISNCTKKSTIISLYIYDRQFFIGSKCLYEKYIIQIFIKNAIKNKTNNVLPYSGLLFIQFLISFNMELL